MLGGLGGAIPPQVLGPGWGARLRQEGDPMRLVLHVWRQSSREAEGAFERYEIADANEHMSFLELLDVLNERLLAQGDEPIAFDSDCREGICGTCGFLVNGVAHGPRPA